MRQTWLCKKDKRYVGLKVIAPRGQKRVRFEIVEATSAKGLGFDPGAGSRGGNATCPCCGTVCDAEYVQSQGIAKCTGAQLLAIVCSRPGSTGKIYLAESDLSDELLPKEDGILRQMEALCRESDLSVPDEPINPLRPSPNARGLSAVTRHGFTTFGDLFSPRQQLVLLTFAKAIRELGSHIPDPARARAIADSCAVVLDKVASRYSTFSPWDAPYEKIVLVFGKHMLPMVWDYAEAVPLVEGSGGWLTALKDVVQAIQENEGLSRPASCQRGSATELSNSTGTVDAVITDPLYYDNITDEQRSQLREREATEQAAAESAFLRLYTEVWLPRTESGGIGIEKVAVGGRPLQMTLNANKQAMIHERVVELITSVLSRVFGSLTPAKIVELFKLGEDQPPLVGIRTREVMDGFYSFLGFTRLTTSAVIRKAIARGVQEGVFGYVAGSPPDLGADGKDQVALTKVHFAMAVSDDEIDLESGFLMMPRAIPQAAPAPEPQPPTPGPIGGPIVTPGPIPPVPVPRPPIPPIETTVELAFTADQSQLYTAWNAIANLADLAGKVTITVRAESAEGFDQSRLRNGVIEPLREADLIE